MAVSSVFISLAVVTGSEVLTGSPLVTGLEVAVSEVYSYTQLANSHLT